MQDFKKGDSVLYVADHLKPPYNHDDLKPGVVSSVNKSFVFVKFYISGTDQLQSTSQACARKNLARRP